MDTVPLEAVDVGIGGMQGESGEATVCRKAAYGDGLPFFCRAEWVDSPPESGPLRDRVSCVSVRAPRQPPMMRKCVKRRQRSPTSMPSSSG